MTSYEEVLQRINPVIESQARYVAWMCQRFHGGLIDWQDLAQSARVYLWQYLERRENPGLRILIVLGQLRMYAERSRGRSVLRAHPGKRQRHYERATLDQADCCISTGLEPYPMFTDEYERDLLLSALHTAQEQADDQGEHSALLALRRFARALQDEALVADCTEQLREWWRRHRLQGEEVRP